MSLLPKTLFEGMHCVFWICIWRRRSKLKPSISKTSSLFRPSSSVPTPTTLKQSIFEIKTLAPKIDGIAIFVFLGMINYKKTIGTMDFFGCFFRDHGYSFVFLELVGFKINRNKIKFNQDSNIISLCPWIKLREYKKLCEIVLCFAGSFSYSILIYIFLLHGNQIQDTFAICFSPEIIFDTHRLMFWC